MTAPAIPAEVAAAIRALVLPASLIANCAPLDLCPCQYGSCGHCAAGRHGQCTTTRLKPRPTDPHTWILTTAGVIANARVGGVWTVGRPCQWVCTCPTCRHPRPWRPAVVAPGNPPARPRAIWEALALIPDAPTAPAPARPATEARQAARPRPTVDVPTLF